MKDRIVNVSSVQKASTQLSRVFPDMVHWPANESVGSTQTRKRVPVGGRPSSFKDEKPFLHTSTKVVYPSGTVRVKDWDGSILRYTGQGSASMSGQYAPLHLDISYPPGNGPKKYGPNTGTGVNLDLLSQAEVKALNKLRAKSGQEDLDFGLWFGERRETARLFAEVAVGVLNLAQSIARKDFRKSAEVLRDVFGVSTSARAERQRMRRLERWLRKETKRAPQIANRTLKGLEDAVLTYNLGVSPLLNDLETIHRRLVTGDLTSKMAVKAVAKHTRHTEGSETLTVDNLGCQNTVSFTQDHGYTVTIVAVPIHTDRARMSRLGLTNPLNTLYQLAGGSFLLDYVYSMGPYLESLSVPMEFEFKAGSYTQRIVLQITQAVKSSLGKMADGKVILNHTERKLYTRLPVPLPPLSLSGRDLSFKQFVNTSLLAIKQLRSLLGK